MKEPLVDQLTLSPPSTGGAMTHSVRTRRRLLRSVRQGAIVLSVLTAVVWFAMAVRAGLARNGIAFDMGFLTQPAGFDISEGLVFASDGLRRFQSGDSNAQALLAGFGNTVKTAVLAIALSTVLGTLLGVGRLSHNWLVRQSAFGLVEFVRNTPMLIQLVFWYFGVVLKLPPVQEASRWFGGVIASQQGVFLPGLWVASEASTGSVLALIAGLLALAAGLAWQRGRWPLLGLALVAFVASAATGFPLSISTPTVDGFAVTGGINASPEFSALLLGLTVYTAAFIAEIVRGAILALPRGQWEASAALGMTRFATFREVVVPQVYRVVLPAFGNQYISLAKTTSLGIAIGYPDLFNVYGTVSNQSGRSLEGVIVAMLAYLLLSWVISAVVNLVNGRMLRKGGAR
jgi:His/Glu/Gln/Arg/opine family amino acid ABC transporter permease subunit